MNEIISNISYTNKDFNTIYTELLDLVKELTTKWDPSQSNESDPGVLLLKLCAIIADKNNYNIDKAILECFPQSVTQIGNARNLYNYLGYSMEWYKSAFSDLGNVGFKALPKLYSNDQDTKNYTIPAFTNLTDSTGEIIYTTLRDVTLQETTLDDVIYTPVIQGSYQDYEINGNTQISVNNLSADRKLYFTETYIAENGIFIQNNKTGNFYDNKWEKVNNLMSYPLGNKVFEFGITETGTCYIQFPEDIATLAPDGFYIRYMISNGKNGNIKANTLTDFLTDIVDGSNNILNQYIQISQPYAITNGADPESLDDAYNNYKKTIGTFNTLITRRDFENFILRLNEVANCIVSDRTCDINNTNYIQKWTPDYTTKDLISRNIKTVDTNGDLVEDVINPFFTMYLYLVNYLENINIDNYNLSYKVDKNSTVLDTILSDINEIKAAQYDIKTHTGDSIFNFNNIYTLKGVIYPKFKVTRAEKRSIENNIKLALVNNFNPKTLTYGEELDYQKVIDVIKNSDTRINNVLLNNFNYNTYKRDFNNRVDILNTSTNDINDLDSLVARMILSGNVQLFNFDDNFNFEFGQTARQSINNIKTINSEVTIDLNSRLIKYTIKPNELIELYTDNYLTIAEYGVNIHATFKSDISENIPAYTLYKLGVNETIEISYKDAITNEDVTTTLSDVIIETNRDLLAGTEIILNTSDYIKVKQKNSFKIKQNSKYIAFFNNRDKKALIPVYEEDGSGNSIIKSYEYILQENEYLAYLNTTATGLVILGMGTKLSSAVSLELLNKRGQVNLDDLNNENIDNIEWDILSVDLNATEMLITTLGEGIKIVSNSDITLNNTLQPLTSILTYSGTSSGKIQSTALQVYQIRSRLNLNATMSNSQELQEGQKLTFTLSDDSTVELNGYEDADGNYIPKYLQFNYNVILTGGENIDTEILNLDENNLTKSSTLDCYSYELTETQPNRIQGNILYKGKISGSTGKTTVTLPDFQINDNDNSVYLVPIKIDIQSNPTNAKINISGATQYTHYDKIDGYTVENNLGNIYRISKSSTVRFEFIDTNESDTVQIGKIYKIKTDTDGNILYNLDEINYKDLNQDYNVKSRVLNILKQMSDVDINNEFNWTYKVLEEDKVLQPTSPSAFWNSNHIGNLYTISKLDIDNSSLIINQNYIV